MARLRYIAMSVPNPATAAKLYCSAFDMKTVGEIESPFASRLRWHRLARPAQIQGRRVDRHGQELQIYQSHRVLGRPRRETVGAHQRERRLILPRASLGEGVGLL